MPLVLWVCWLLYLTPPGRPRCSSTMAPCALIQGPNGAQSRQEFRVKEEQTGDWQEAKEARHTRTNLKGQPSSDLQVATLSNSFLAIFS